MRWLWVRLPLHCCLGVRCSRCLSRWCHGWLVSGSPLAFWWSNCLLFSSDFEYFLGLLILFPHSFVFSVFWSNVLFSSVFVYFLWFSFFASLSLRLLFFCHFSLAMLVFCFLTEFVLLIYRYFFPFSLFWHNFLPFLDLFFDYYSEFLLFFIFWVFSFLSYFLQCFFPFIYVSFICPIDLPLFLPVFFFFLSYYPFSFISVDGFQSLFLIFFLLFI